RRGEGGAAGDLSARLPPPGALRRAIRLRRLALSHRRQRLPRPGEAAAPPDLLRPAGTDLAAAERPAHRPGARHRLAAAEGAPGGDPARRRAAVDRGGGGDSGQLAGHRPRAAEQGARETAELAVIRGPLPLSDDDFAAVRAA